MRSQLRRCGAVVVAVAAVVGLWNACAGTARAGDKDKGVPIGTQVADLEFKDVWYLPRSLSELGPHKATVIVFTLVGDPAMAIWLPELKRLDEMFAEQDVQFLAINSGNRDSIRHMASQALEYEVPFPFVKDFSGQCARALGVSTVGTVVVLDDQRHIRYRGRIDDRLTASEKPNPQAEPKRRDLVEALRSVLSGSTVDVAETPVVGTPLADASDDASDAVVDESVTFAQHIAPLMEKYCQRCHRPGTEAPFSLITYDDVAANADMVREVVLEERMPPWYASFGHFVNDPMMRPEEKRLIRSWIDAGCPPGDLSRLPKPPADLVKPIEWRIDKPDLVISMKQSHKLPADGYVPYKYVILPYRFPHDTWIQQAEILPDNPRVVHHCNMAYIANALDWTSAKFVMGRVPGIQPMRLTDNVGFLIPKGAMLVLQIHYTTTGQPETCRISVGMRYAREVIHQQLHYLWMIDTDFAIPPGDPCHRVVATSELDCDAVAAGLFAHMHLRGKAMSFFARYPNGEVEKLLEIPNYSFDWQLAYRWDLGKHRFPKGTKIECVAYYDNSAFNPYNPDPTETVREGQQTFHEMLNGVMFYLDENEHLNLHIDPKTGKVVTPETADQRSGNTKANRRS